MGIRDYAAFLWVVLGALWPLIVEIARGETRARPLGPSLQSTLRGYGYLGNDDRKLIDGTYDPSDKYTMNLPSKSWNPGDEVSMRPR